MPWHHYYQLLQHGWYCFHLVCLCVCVIVQLLNVNIIVSPLINYLQLICKQYLFVLSTYICLNLA